MIIYLYVKQHSITQLKYFGKTVQSNPYKYLGSGEYWASHINKHGKQYVETISLWEFDDQEKATEFALQFSKENNIVESDEWANLRFENATDGNIKGYIPSVEARKRLSNTTKGVPKSDAHRKSLSESLKGIPKPLETKLKMSKARIGAKLTDAAKSKISKIHKDKPRNKLKCPHCGKIGGDGAMIRWHFDNCKWSG